MGNCLELPETPWRPILSTSLKGVIYLPMMFELNTAEAMHLWACNTISVNIGVAFYWFIELDCSLWHLLYFKINIFRLIQFRSRYEFDQAFRLIGKKGRLYRMEKVIVLLHVLYSFYFIVLLHPAFVLLIIGRLTESCYS